MRAPNGHRYSAGLRIPRSLAHLDDEQIAKAFREGLVFEHDGVLFPAVSGFAECTAGFETGINGDPILTTDAGNATAWDAITLGTGGTALYDNVLVRSGALSGKLTRGTAGTVLLSWIAAFGTNTDHYGRLYVYLTANPGAAFGLIVFRSGASNACNFRLLTTGTIQLRDQGGGGIGTTAAALGLNQWTMLEWHVVHSTTVGQVELKVYNDPTSISPTETLTTAADKNLLASSDRVQFISDQNVGYVVQFDNIIAGASAYPGPLTAGVWATERRLRRNILLRRSVYFDGEPWYSRVFARDRDLPLVASPSPVQS